MHETMPSCGVWWQTGYGAFTVSHSALDRVREYVLRQEEHHHARRFQDEFRKLVRKHGLEPDEVHMWD